MPSFLGDEATHYDQRIHRLVPGYDLLQQLTQAHARRRLARTLKCLWSASVPALRFWL